MCGIAGIFQRSHDPLPDMERRLAVMNYLQRHRGPDGEGVWKHARGHCGLAHRRLSIIDLDTGAQPMRDGGGNWITYNGEIYNYRELRKELGAENFRTNSDTEVILHAYRKWGNDCVKHFRGMFAFALWDESKQELFCARDRFGIKPFHYAVSGGVFYFASEVKALLPFLKEVETDFEGLKDYLAFQFCLDGKTLFRGVQELLPAHRMSVSSQSFETSRYWEVYYDLDFHREANSFAERLEELLEDSVKAHLVSDVPLGAYLSGGLDSSIVSVLASRNLQQPLQAFHGKFEMGPAYDESSYAREAAEKCGAQLIERSINGQDFINSIRQVIYHLDYPVAGTGSFSQFMISQKAAKYRKVMLGGQGGDEIFGGYTRYLIAYFEQCIKAAIDGTMNNGNFIVTYESIIPNLAALRNYKPLLQEFWAEGLFEDMDKRYFRLINRTPQIADEVQWELLGNYSPFETFRKIFHSQNVKKESYFDLMTHFDFKTLLPALLHVEDRVSMAHGIESRVPLLDHPLVEFAASVPPNIKFKNGTMKHLLKKAATGFVPSPIVNRQDKMGFPTPFVEWIKTDARSFVCDTLSTAKAKGRGWVHNDKVLAGVRSEKAFGRTIWGYLSLEIWQQEFHDKASDFRKLLVSLVPAKASSLS